MVRVLILEDDIIISRDLVEIVEEIVEEVHLASSYEEAMALLNQFSFDLCLSDINLNEEKTGICFAKEIVKRSPNVELIYITAHYDEATIAKTEGTNPLNFIVKPYTEQQIKTTVNLAINKIKSQQNRFQELAKLTKQEQKILLLITKNKSNKEIADDLFVSEKTVRNHRYNMLKKLEILQEKNALLFFGLKVFPPEN